MPEAFYFGHPRRALLGLRHAPATAADSAMLVCAPLLQEGIRCQRALWSLAETLAGAGMDVMRFDWFGAGDSSGTAADMDVPGLVDDIASADALLRASGRNTRPRLFGLRSAALPLMLYANTRQEPVDIVLWAPALDGRALVALWREQHRRQLQATGRFLSAQTTSADNELLGFVLDAGFIERLAAIESGGLTLPAGSRLLVVQWRSSPATQAFVAAQRAVGVDARELLLRTGDEPDWDDPDQFETQVYPRRAVAELAVRIAEAA